MKKTNVFIENKAALKSRDLYLKENCQNRSLSDETHDFLPSTCVYFVDSLCFSGLFETNRPDSDSIRSALRHPGRKTDKSFWNNLRSAFLHWQLENLSLWNSKHNTGSRNSGRCNANCWQVILLCNACKYP